MARQFLKIEVDRGGEKDIENIAAVCGVALLAGGDFEDVGALVNDAFGKQKTNRQLGVVAGSPHRDRDALAAHADFQRLLDGENVGVRCQGTVWRTTPNPSVVG